MKKVLSILLSLSLAIIMLVSCTPAKPTPESSSLPRTTPALVDDAVLTFCVLTDTHIGDKNTTESFEKMMTYIKSLDKAPDAFLFAGDLTNSTGSSKADTEIVQFKTLYEKYGKPSQIMYCLGPTHDTPAGADGKTCRQLYEKTFGEEYFKDLLQGNELKTEGLRHKVIGGFNFFAIDWEGKNDGYMSAGEKEYLETTLEKLTKEDPDKPIFVVNHVLYPDLEEILSKYPQAICFKGHLHNSIARADAITQDKGFTKIECGGLNYYRVDGYNRFTSNPYLNLGDIYNFAQGVYVQVDKDNNVTLTRIDGYNESTIGEQWKVGPDIEMKYTSSRKNNYVKCSFADSDAKITETETALSIAFDAAKSGDAGPAMYYSVKLYQKNSVGEFKVAESKDISSQQVFFPDDKGIPDLYYKTVFSSNDGFGNFAIVITATDCFGESDEALIYTNATDFTSKKTSAGNVQYEFKELTEEEKKIGLVTEGEQEVSFSYSDLSAFIYPKNTDTAVRFHPSYEFKDVKVRCSSNGDTTGTFIFKLYEWKGDYKKTVSGKAVDTFKLSGFKGSTVYTVTTKTHKAGEYLMTITTPNYQEGVGVYVSQISGADNGAYVSYTNGIAMDPSIYLAWTNNATCEHPYIKCE